MVNRVYSVLINFLVNLVLKNETYASLSLCPIGFSTVSLQMKSSKL